MEHPTWEELTDYLDKRLAADRNAIVEAHIASCDECAEQLDWLYKGTNLLRADTFVPPPRRVRVAAESLFDLRFGKGVVPAITATVAIPLAVEGDSSPSPVTGGKVIALSPPTDRPKADNVIRPTVSYWRRMAWISGAVAALLVIAFFATQPQQGPLVAAVQEQQGQVDIVSTNSGFNLPFTGSTLSEGSSIATGTDGTAQLVFANGAVRVVMLEDSNLVYVGGVETEGAITSVNLATDRAGDLEIDVQSGITVDLQTGVGLFTTTGGRYRFHYLEPKIIGIQVLRGMVTVRSEFGVYEMPEGTDEILDYTQPFSTPTPEPTVPASPTVPAPTSTSVPATPTTLPTRLPPSATAVASVTSDDSGTESESESSTDDDSRSTDSGATNTDGETGSGSVLLSPTPEVIPTTAPAPEAPEAEPETPVEVEEDTSESGGDNSGSGSGDSGSGNDHDSEPEHEDNSGSGSGNSGSGGGGDDDDSEHD
jgi:hypothetical protein